MIGEDDLATILSNGDFDTSAVFTIPATFGPDTQVTVRGWFTEPSDATVIYGVEIEAAKPTLMTLTSGITAVRNKYSVVINSTTYVVEKIEKVGTGVSVVYLKT